jgi:hypothetical protein
VLTQHFDTVADGADITPAVVTRWVRAGTDPITYLFDETDYAATIPDGPSPWSVNWRCRPVDGPSPITTTIVATDSPPGDGQVVVTDRGTPVV